jgi:cytidylate kinase
MADAKAQGDAISGMRAVTISREYGSGGGEIAARLAKRLGWQLIHHQIVMQVAKALGVTQQDAEAHDEHAEGLVARVLYGLSAIQPPMPGGVPIDLSIDSRSYDEARTRAVEGAIAAGQVVIVGRGAQVLLADRRDVLHVRVVAPLEQRIAYVMKREGLDRAAAQARIQQKDRDRLRFLMTAHHRNAEDAHLYDIVVNTGVLDLDSVVEMLVAAIERKAARLSTPAGELGPAAGLDRYPEPPGDFASAGGESNRQ